MRISLIIGVLMLSLTGCITQPKQTLQANVPSGLDRGDVELAILLATGLSAPDNEKVATWAEYVSATLRNAGDRHVSRLDEADDEDRWVFDTADGKSITASYVDGKEILRVTIDTNHWMSAGNDNETQVMIEGSRVFAPLKLNSGRNVGIYGTKDKLIASGLIWPDAQDILVQKAFLMEQPFGQGHVVAFAEEPNYRAFTESTMLLFMNAVLLGPGY